MSNWVAYWKDVERAPVEKLVQWWKVKFGYHRFADYVPRGKVLEVGSGRGEVSKELKRRGYSVVTSDIGPGSDMRFDVRKIPFNNNAFDIVMSTGLMEHFEGREWFAIRDEQLRVAPTVIMNVPDRCGTWYVLWAIRRALGAKLDLHFNLMTKERLEDMGHEVKRVWFFCFPYLVVTCKRPS